MQFFLAKKTIYNVPITLDSSLFFLICFVCTNQHMLIKPFHFPTVRFLLIIIFWSKIEIRMIKSLEADPTKTKRWIKHCWERTKRNVWKQNVYRLTPFTQRSQSVDDDDQRRQRLDVHTTHTCSMREIDRLTISLS